MNQQQFDTIFTALYFALSTHNKDAGITIRKGRSFFAEGYAVIELDQGYSLKLELADLVAYRDASPVKKQRLLGGLIGQARMALTGTESAVNTSQDSREKNEA